MRRFPRVSGRGFHLSYDTHELSFPRRSKRTVNGVVAAIREDPRIRFVAFKDPEKPEPTDWNNSKGLQAALDHITKTMADKFE